VGTDTHALEYLGGPRDGERFCRLPGIWGTDDHALLVRKRLFLCFSVRDGRGVPFGTDETAHRPSRGQKLRLADPCLDRRSLRGVGDDPIRDI